MIKFTADKSENISKQILKHTGLPFGVVQKKLRGKEVMVGEIRVNGGGVKKGDEITVFAEEKRIEAKIIYEDELFLIADKPRGIETVDFADMLGCHAIHRLDRNTAGVLMLAKTKSALRLMLNALKTQPAEKTYIAKVFGHARFMAQIYTAYLLKRENESFVKIYPTPMPKTVRIDTWLRAAKSGWDTTLVECKITNGKTHQIRAHLAYLGFPIVGDEKYGNSELNKKHNVKYQELYAVKIKTKFTGDLAYLNEVKMEARYEITL